MKSFVGALLVAAAVASPWSALVPVETGKAEYDLENGMSPMPTMAPLLSNAVDLRKRLLFQDRTCGFTSGDPDSPDLCVAGLTCAVNRASNAIACCSDLSSCGVYTGCYDRTSLTCTTSGCSRNTAFTSCSDSVSSLCASWVYLLGANTGYYYTCATRRFAITVLTTATSSSSGSSTRSSFSLTTSSSDSTSAQKSSTSAAPIQTVSPTDSPTAAAKKTNVGAIVGGVVGGLGALALIGVGACLLLTRKKKQPPAQAGAAPYVPPAGPQQPPSYPQKDYYGNPIASPGAPSPGYAQPMGQVASPGGYPQQGYQQGYPQQGYPTPQQGYAQPGYSGTPVGYAGTPPMGAASNASPVYHHGGSPPAQNVVSPVPAAGFQHEQPQSQFTAELPAGSYK